MWGAVRGVWGRRCYPPRDRQALHRVSFCLRSYTSKALLGGCGTAPQPPWTIPAAAYPTTSCGSLPAGSPYPPLPSHTNTSRKPPLPAQSIHPYTCTCNARSNFCTFFGLKHSLTLKMSLSTLESRKQWKECNRLQFANEHEHSLLMKESNCSCTSSSNSAPRGGGGLG